MSVACSLLALPITIWTDRNRRQTVHQVGTYSTPISWWSWSVGLHPIVQGGFVIGPADWMLRIAFPSWFHSCSIGLRSRATCWPLRLRYLPGLQVISDDDPGSMRANIKSRQMPFNQTMTLWNLGNEIMFRLSAFMSFILCMEITNKWLVQSITITLQS